MKTKRILLTIFIATFFSTSYAQLGGKPFKEKYDDLKKKKLMVLIKDNDPFSAALKKSVEENWTFCEYEFISEETLSKYTKNDDVYILVYSDLIRLRRYGISSPHLFFDPILGISYGVLKDEPIHRSKFLAFIQYPLSGIQEKYLEGYLNLHIQLLHNYILFKSSVKNSKSGYSYRNYVTYSDHIKTKNVECKYKKILICEDDLYVDEDKINDKYNFDYEIVTRDRIHEAILNKEDVIIFYMIKLLDSTNYFLVSAKDGNPLYYVKDTRAIESLYGGGQKRLFKILAKSE